jgi:glutamate racemase
MDERPIVFLDSGIGGIPYCGDFHRRNPHEPLIYAADAAHFPYGKRSREELAEILTNLIRRLVSLADPKLAVLACNTATVSAIERLRELFPELPFVGTVPAVKPAVLASKKKSIGVLGTERTVTDPYIAELASRCGPGCAVTALAAPELVDFVEHRFAGAAGARRLEAVLPYMQKFRAAGADALVLGCTHFLFLLDEFRRAAGPDIKVYDSIGGISRRVEALLDGDGGRLRAGPPQADPDPERNRFFVTGAEAPSWRFWASGLGFSLVFLDPAAGL